MTPQERDLVTQLLARLKEAGVGQGKDPEAEQLIKDAVAKQPDAPYYLVQTVLIQDMALANAQTRIAELEKQLAQAQPPAQPRSFLGGLLGGHQPSAPASGPWSRPAPPQPGYQAPGPWAAPPVPGPGPWGGGGSGFLRSAAATAAGIAGGALLFEGIQSLFGPHWGSGYGIAAQPGISETVINNYYGTEPAPGGDRSQAWDSQGALPAADAAADPAADYAADQDFSSEDFAANDDYGGDDVA